MTGEKSDGAALDATTHGWPQLRDALGAPGSGARSAAAVAGGALEALDRYAEAKVAAGARGAASSDCDDIERYVQQVLSTLRDLRDASTDDIRALVAWSTENTTLSTYTIGKAAGLSSSTVRRLDRRGKRVGDN
ncbi:hypothetical protein [Demequina globuliformis]|uniref:hypothetical protein n=1 Tax=Demequina globuliformis TaxID=676202 RepID=UPI000A4D5AB3|nr:hypothetical protein [Demequina globuliformis]